MSGNQWLAVRSALSVKQTRGLTLMSFLPLPLLIWSVVSYVPFVWHPNVEVMDPGGVTWFSERDADRQDVFAGEADKAMAASWPSPEIA